MSTSDTTASGTTTRHVRLRVDIVLEIDGPADLTAAAEGRIDSDEFMPADERDHARAAVQEDPSEALAYLVEPFDLVRDLPGVELVQAAWSSEEIEYDPDSMEWELDEEDEVEEDDDDRL
ncbi:hypothetical protein GCM10017562_47620 [Streptomyces roseofulvus]|uniref:Uncharacterized protein n=2 Tax=Streptomyces TaxID=1883 RepID=A0ABU4K7D3_9ACTN|nr:hypothetical protein [Streptomyces roseolus]MDX2293662.1 hypothetical protein [Streptomyces roseolus]